MQASRFTSSPITDAILTRIWNKSYPSDCHYDVANLSYLTVLYYDFQNTVQEGELIVNTKIAEKTLAVFKELFDHQYPIERICLIDEFDADDYRSMAANNSSAFNYRYIDSTTVLSNHSEGLAIDINPLYNPYIKEVNGALRILPAEGTAYADRQLSHPYYIRRGDICYNAFIRQGFTWGGDWTESKDYQHFEFGTRKPDVPSCPPTESSCR